METAAPTIRALELENQRLRADVAELVAKFEVINRRLSNGSLTFDGLMQEAGFCADLARAARAKHGA